MRGQFRDISFRGNSSENGATAKFVFAGPDFRYNEFERGAVSMIRFRVTFELNRLMALDQYAAEARVEFMTLPLPGTWNMFETIPAENMKLNEVNFEALSMNVIRNDAYAMATRRLDAIEVDRHIRALRETGLDPDEATVRMRMVEREVENTIIPLMQEEIFTELFSEDLYDIKERLNRFFY